MAGALRTAGMVIGTVAAVLPGPWQPFAVAASLALNVGAALLQKKPPVLGSPSDITIGANNPSPYAMGRTRVAGTMVHRIGYGPTTGGVPNPYLSMVMVGHAAGPSEALEAFQAENVTIPFAGGNAIGYYHDRLYLSSQLGACPEASALAGPFGAIPNWGPDHKLSGKTAWLVTLRDDREGKTFAAGIPNLAMVGRWALVYDSRQDATYPGGAGACRAGFEQSYVGGAAAENPSCHAVTYAIGRWQGPEGQKKLVMGVGFAAPDTPAASPAEAAAAIDWPAWTEFANVCDANAWKIGGVVYEPGSGWDNLKRICAAGGAKPTWVGGKLTVIFPRPRVAIDTIGVDDVAEGDISIQYLKSAKTRPNILVPKLRLESQHWESVQIAAVRSEALIAADGEEKSEEFEEALQLVQQADQAAELAAYELLDRRETGPIVVRCKARMISVRTGQALDLAPEVHAQLDPEDLHGFAGKPLVIIARRLDPATATVELTLETDTPQKHFAALGLAGTAPVPAPRPTPEEQDEAAFALKLRESAALIANSSVSDADPADALLQATDTLIDIEAHARLYADRQVDVDGGTIAPAAAAGQLNHVCYDDIGRQGGAVNYLVFTDPAAAATSSANPDRHYVGSILTPAAGQTSSGGGATPPGWSPGGWYNVPDS